jgi:hypothetical protein
MGVRLYDPTLGRFLQVDPILGGSANAYDYTTQDPVNGFDLGGYISMCSDDFCPAAEARIQATRCGIPAEPILFLQQRQPKHQENLAIDNVPYYGPTSYWRAAADTVKTFEIPAGIVVVPAAGFGVAAEDLDIISGIGTTGTGVTGIETCSDHGFASLKCSGSVVATVASGLSGKLAQRATSRLAKAAWYAGGTIWGHVSHWIGAS